MQTFLLFLVYSATQVLFLLYSAYRSVKAHYTPWEQLREYMAANTADLIGQWMIATGLFLGVWENPAFIIWCLSKVGYVVPGEFIKLTFFSAWALGCASYPLADVILFVLTSVASGVRKRFSA